MRSASALQPSAGAWRSVVSSPLGAAVAGDGGERVDDGAALGIVPPIMTHQADRNSRVARGAPSPRR